MLASATGFVINDAMMQLATDEPPVGKQIVHKADPVTTGGCRYIYTHVPRLIGAGAGQFLKAARG